MAPETGTTSTTPAPDQDPNPKPPRRTPGRPFNRETAKAASLLAHAARLALPPKPKPLPPPPPPIPRNHRAALVEEAMLLAMKSLRGSVRAADRAALMASLASLLRELRAIEKGDDDGDRVAPGRAGRRPEPPGSVLLEDHPGVAAPPGLVEPAGSGSPAAEATTGGVQPPIE